MSEIWTPPNYVSTGEADPGQQNAEVVDNLKYLKWLLDMIGASEVDAAQSTTSASYTNLTTTGPSVTLDTGERAVAVFAAMISTNTNGAGGLVSPQVTGASSIAAADAGSAVATFPTASGAVVSAVGIRIFTTLTPGLNTFRLQYRRSSVSSTATFERRKLLVLPLP